MRIANLKVTIQREQLLVEYPHGLHVCSSAIWGGGFTDASTILNKQVGKDYFCSHPEDDLKHAIRSLQKDPETTVGLLTAARVEQAGEVYEQGSEFQLHAIVTAGVSNAARAGQVEQKYPGYRADTINIIVVIDGKVTDAAMVNAVITATEAKTAALQDLCVTDGRERSATGTNTDAVVIAVTNSDRYQHTHSYCGSATEIGDCLARAVYKATRIAIETDRKRRSQAMEASS